MKRLIITTAVLAMLVVGAGAEADINAVVGQQAEALGTDSLSEALEGEAAEILEDMDIMDSLDFSVGLSRLGEKAASSLGGILAEGLKSTAMIIAVAVLCSIGTTVCDSMGTSGMSRVIPLAGVLAVAAISLGDTRSFIGLGRQTLSDLEVFSKALLPTMTAAATASGQLTSAAAKYAATALFTDLAISLSERVLMPLVYCYTAASVANAAVGNDGLKAAADIIKWICKGILTIMVIAFVAFLTITGVVSGSSDVVSTRLAKTVISTALPVVGSIISDAASTIVAGAGVLKNAVGVFGVIGVAAICLIPFLRLGVHYLLYKIAAGFSSLVGGNSISGLVSALGDAFGIILGMMGSCAIMMFFSIISVIRTVTG